MNKTVALVCVTAVVISVLGLIGWISYTGGDLERILGWSGTTLGPLIGILGTAFMVKKANDRVETVHDQVETVHDNVESAQQEIRIVKVQTNGKMKAFHDRLYALEQAEMKRKGDRQ